MSSKLAIDHPLILVSDIEKTSANFRKLGFDTAPLGFHPWGTSTSLIMFNRSAIEIMGIYDTSLLDSHSIGSFAFGRFMQTMLSEREGISLVALYSEDATGDRCQLEERGITSQGRVDFRRRVKVPDRDWDEAVVSLEIVVDETLPRASNFLCQQHRPELIWVPEWMGHPNGALGFASLTYVTTEEEALLRRFRKIFGEDVVSCDVGGIQVQTGRSHINVRRPHEWATEVGLTSEPSIAPAIAACVGIEVIASDLNRVTSILTENNVPFLYYNNGITVSDYKNYGNTIIRFVSGE